MVDDVVLDRKDDNYSGEVHYAVECSNVVKNFFDKSGKRTSALNCLSFSIEKQKVTAILGPSGAGKTTVARIIGGLESYDDGEIVICDTILNKKTQTKIRKKVAFVFQNFNLFPHLSVLDNITYAPIKVLHEDKDKTFYNAKKMLEQFDLLDKIDCLPCDLSGGQKQRVAVIRALIVKPEILIMDEPTASLDPEHTHDVIDVINNIKKTGVTVIVVTHDIIVAKKATDNVVMLYEGKCVDSMPSRIFFDKSNNNKHVYSQRFLANCE